jgi:hypothetical protein
MTYVLQGTAFVFEEPFIKDDVILYARAFPKKAESGIPKATRT